MAKTLQIGNSTIICTDANEDFHDGYSNGYLYYYDERYRPPFPLTTHHITAFLQTNMTDLRKSESWNVGFITGWMYALYKNDSGTFCSLLPNGSSTQERHSQTLPQRITVSQEA